VSISSIAPCAQDHKIADDIAGAFCTELINELQAHGVHWGPAPAKTHLVFCRLRQGLAQTIRAQRTEARRETIQQIRTRLYG
jgi:hypothetical protein